MRAQIWDSLDNLELRIVRRFAALSRWPIVRAITHAVNVLANGWIYLPMAWGLWFVARDTAWPLLARAMLAVVLAHLLHAWLKRKLRRIRPFERDPSLLCPTRVLDRYSFPSGHCMTLACVTVPIVHGVPVLWPLALGHVVLLAVCRLVAAHHYPSDVLAGISLGLAMGWLATSLEIS